MQRARESWGNADIITGARTLEGNKAPEGGPVHQMLVAKREAKQKRRAERHTKQQAGMR